MWIRSAIVACCIVFAAPTFAANEAPRHGESALAGIEWQDVQKMLRKHFSLEDIDALKDYLKAAMLGLPMPMPPDLKGKVREFMAEMRLEYGFQFSVIIAQLKQKIFRVLPSELAELAEEFTKNPQRESDE